MDQPAKKAPPESAPNPADDIPDEVHQQAAKLAKRLLTNSTDDKEED